MQSEFAGNEVRRIADNVWDAAMAAEDVRDPVEVLVSAVDDVGCDGLIADRTRSVDDAASATGRVHDGADEGLDIEQPLVDPWGFDVEPIRLFDPDVSGQRTMIGGANTRRPRNERPRCDALPVISASPAGR